MLRRLIREERGQASTELMGMVWWLFLVALLVWQLLLAAWAVDQAANAARTASRVEARDGNADKAAHWAVSDGLRKGMKVDDRRGHGHGEHPRPDRVPRPRRRPPAHRAQCDTSELTWA